MLTPERLREWIDEMQRIDDRLAIPQHVIAELRDEHDGALQRFDALRVRMIEAWRDLLAKEVA